MGILTFVWRGEARRGEGVVMVTYIIDVDLLTSPP